jgi:hypothetical protein
VINGLIVGGVGWWSEHTSEIGPSAASHTRAVNTINGTQMVWITTLLQGEALDSVAATTLDAAWHTYMAELWYAP